MASIRKLKKDVNQCAYELLTEAYTYKRFHSELDENKFEEVLRKIVKTRNDIISRINNPEESSEDGKNSAHFAKVNEDIMHMFALIEELKK